MQTEKVLLTLSQPIKNSAGFSLIQALMGVGVTAIMAMVAAQTMSSLHQNSRSIASKSISNSANQSLQVYLAYEHICTQSLQPTTIKSNAEVPLNFNVPGLGIFKAGQKNKTLDIDIQSISVNDLIVSETNPLGMKIYLGTLKSSYSRQNGKQISHFKESPVGTLSLMTTSEGRVIKCSLGKLVFNSVPQNTLTPPTQAVVQPPASGTSGSSNPSTPSTPSETAAAQPTAYPPPVASTPASAPRVCTSIEQCAVYDFFLRNGSPNPYGQADEWMAGTAAWTSIAKSYVDSMSTLGKLNFLASVNQAGLVQTGVHGYGGQTQKPDTIDQWVVEAVTLDPSGRTMLTTSEGLNTLKTMFDAGSETSSNTQTILRSALTKSPDLTLNSALGIGAWVDALGFANATEMAKNMPAAAVNAALNPSAGKDPVALKAVVEYINANPAEAVKIANGTGIWAKNVQGNVSTVISYITTTLAATGNNDLAISIAKATDQWAGIVGSDAVGKNVQQHTSATYAVADGTATWNSAAGSAAVTDAIKSNTAGALNVAYGTSIVTSVVGKEAVIDNIKSNAGTSAQVAAGVGTAAQIFGEDAVKSAIAADPAAAARGASLINQAKEAGYTDAQIKSYIDANPDWYK
ncbi:hypothetical protein [Bdellovibrio sp.]|uniref:hypothetical protein n=1 Tax=Bdellovibrio sp. TaxID=28201 RepID=UPI0039E4C92D